MVSGCCKDKCQDPSNPECGNYNPCYGKQETSADFYTEVKAGNRWFESDFAFTGFRFRAKDTSADEYLWEIGSEKYTTRSLYLDKFPNSTSIKLTVKRNKPYTSCFPNDKGIVTMTKVVYTDNTDDFYEYMRMPDTQTPRGKYKMLNGRYEGFNKRNPNFKFKVEYKLYASQLLYGNGVLGYSRYATPPYDITNIPYYGRSLSECVLEDEKILPYYRQMGYSREGVPIVDDYAGDYCANHNGIMSYDNQPKNSLRWKYYDFFKYYAWLDHPTKDKITIEYWYVDTITRKVLKDTFLGTRIP
jgi:hypothetical protein